MRSLAQLAFGALLFAAAHLVAAPDAAPGPDLAAAPLVETLARLLGAS